MLEGELGDRNRVRASAWLGSVRLGPAWLLAALHLVLGVLLLRRPEDLFDDGYTQLASLRWRHGELPYRDFFWNVTPGTLVVQGLLQRWLGVDPLVRRAYVFLELAA